MFLLAIAVPEMQGEIKFMNFTWSQLNNPWEQWLMVVRPIKQVWIHLECLDVQWCAMLQAVSDSLVSVLYFPYFYTSVLILFIFFIDIKFVYWCKVTDKLMSVLTVHSNKIWFNLVWFLILRKNMLVWTSCGSPNTELIHSQSSLWTCLVLKFDSGVCKNIISI